MPKLKIAALIAKALLGSTMMIGLAAAITPNGLSGASKPVTATIQDVRYQPDHGWRGAGWHRPWGWRHRWSGAKLGAKDRAD